MEVVQSTHVPELERGNAELRAELEHAHLKNVETEERQNSLRSGYTKREDECEVLRHAAESLKWEKVEAETDH
jgi:hypothetical protein